MKQQPASAGDPATAHIRRFVREVLADAALRGYPPPSAVRIDAASFAVFGRRAPRIPALADYSTGEIHINPASYHFRHRHGPRRYARRYHARGYISTSDPGHVLRHELAHL